MTFLKDRRFVLGAGLSVLLILLFVATHRGKEIPDTLQALSAEKGTSTPSSFDIAARTSTPLQENTNYYIDSVVGSDTVTLRTGGSGTLFRLLGVQSPVRAGFGNCYDKDIASGILEMISSGTVFVRFDPGGVLADGAGNPAGYVYLSDGTLLNTAILEKGYGKFFPGTSAAFESELSVAEQNARISGRGIWAGACKTTAATTPTLGGTNASDPWGINEVKKGGSQPAAGSTSTTGGSTTGTGTTGGSQDTSGLSELPPPPPPPPPPM